MDKSVSLCKSCCENQMQMMSIEELCQKFETKILEEQEKKGKNSRILIKEQFDETVKRLKMLEYVGEQRNLSDFNLIRRFSLLRVPNVDRGRCEFPNVRAAILDINEAGMYKLGTKEGQLKGVYSRNDLCF